MKLWPLRIHRWTLLRRITAGGFLALLVLGGFSWFPWFQGSASATSFFKVVPFVDPLAGLEMMIAARQLHTEVLIGGGLVLLVTLLLGPVFCGWICPLGLLLDLNQTVRGLFIRTAPYAPKQAKASFMPHDSRYALLAVFIGLAAVSQLPVFQIISPISLLVRGIVFAPDFGLLVVLAIVLIEYPWPRLWCRRLCPLGALHSLAGRFGVLRIRIRPGCGKPCWQCSRHCPMGISITADHVLAEKRHVDDPACTRCGDCADRCPRDVLTLGFDRPGRHAPDQSD